MSIPADKPLQPGAAPGLSPAERRSEERTATVLRPALLEAGEFQTFCLVRNLSASGLKARVFAPLEDGADVLIRLGDGLAVQGHVVWRETDALGVAFESPLDLDAALALLAQPKHETGEARAPRLEVVAQARFTTHERSYRAEVIDISPRGIKGRFDAETPPIGKQGMLTIDGLAPRKAVARWVRENTAGFYFLEPIGFAELGQWVMDRFASTSEGDQSLSARSRAKPGPRHDRAAIALTKQ